MKNEKEKDNLKDGESILTDTRMSEEFLMAILNCQLNCTWIVHKERQRKGETNDHNYRKGSFQVDNRWNFHNLQLNIAACDRLPKKQSTE